MKRIVSWRFVRGLLCLIEERSRFKILTEKYPRIQMVTISHYYNLGRICELCISWWAQCNYAYNFPPDCSNISFPQLTGGKFRHGRSRFRGAQWWSDWESTPIPGIFIVMLLILKPRESTFILVHYHDVT